VALAEIAAASGDAAVGSLGLAGSAQPATTAMPIGSKRRCVFMGVPPGFEAEAIRLLIEQRV
jgi:hypothetical protein